jgi:hypothetical protein
MSSRSLLRGRCVLRPGGRLVVEGAGLEAAVQDAGEPVGELAQGGVVPGAAGALEVVVGSCSSAPVRAAFKAFAVPKDVCSCWEVLDAAY